MNTEKFIYQTLDPSFVPDELKNLSDLSECIQNFSQLPKIVLKDFLPSSDQEQELIKGIKDIYYWTERWLYCDLLHQNSLKSYLLSTSGKHFKTYKEVSKTVYQLCQEVYDYPAGWATKYFRSAAGLWLSCEYEKCLLGIENSGLTGKPIFVSKRQYQANMYKYWGKQGRAKSKEIIGVFEDPNKSEIYPDNKFGVPMELVSPFHMLILTVSYLAKGNSIENITFREGTYRNYQKAVKNHARYILKTTNLQGVYFAYGELINTQSTANLPGSGFLKPRK
ncbi:MAG: hypothetical protein PT119_19795 [Aphanizomenon gracile PMC627.10]|nr:hypothetical protein [Aphanizomenon gracile PMC627.10]